MRVEIELLPKDVEEIVSAYLVAHGILCRIVEIGPNYNAGQLMLEVVGETIPDPKRIVPPQGGSGTATPTRKQHA